MLKLLWLIPAAPFLGFILLSVFGRMLPRRAATVLGVGSAGLSAGLSLLLASQFIASPPAGHRFVQNLWTWMQAGSFTSQFSLVLDPLSLVMMVVVTFIGFLIHVYSVEYMHDDSDFARFFAFLNLFVAAMLLLVLGDNLLLLYFGWEGVGLCSYLLIGFWYEKPDNGRCARKAFIVTRVGDTALGMGLFLLFKHFGTLDIQALLAAAPQQWVVGSTLAVLAAALILGGAIGKSAQLPLQVWLPDAMAGPTPVSALLHSATMVTAGVYLIARMNGIFLLAPSIMALTAGIGAATLLIAGFSALNQTDIKRVLAYSSISQIGYMFLALGVGAWSAAAFHFFTHAFFKALLFMGAGAIIHALHHEQDMFKMGGLKKKMPAVFWTFLAGAASLAALPLVTAGFYSKDAILWAAYSSPFGGNILWIAGAAGAFLTSLYTFRMVFLVFFGVEKTHVHQAPGKLMTTPLIILAALAIVAGFLETPHTLGHVTVFSQFLQPLFPFAAEGHGGVGTEVLLQSAATVLSLLGVFAAYLYFYKRPPAAPSASASSRFWRAGWGFDWFYDKTLVRPFYWLARVNRGDFVDSIYTGLASANEFMSYMMSLTQSGNVRWYALGTLAGVAFSLGWVILK